LDASSSPQLDRLAGPRRGPALTIDVDGESIPCFAGETIAVAILAVRSWIGQDAVRRRGLYCGIGVCFECVVAVEGVPGTRACITLVREGMSVQTRLDAEIDA
jgi:predicted molibdopterin-dependent oxidoreductase YjgC